MTLYVFFGNIVQITHGNSLRKSWILFNEIIPNYFSWMNIYINPSQENLFELGRSLCWQGKYSVGADMAFKKLAKAGKLDDFLKIIMPEDLPELPGPSQPIIKNNIKIYPSGYKYYEQTFKDLPHRKEALHFLMHSIIHLEAYQ